MCLRENISVSAGLFVSEQSGLKTPQEKYFLKHLFIFFTVGEASLEKDDVTCSRAPVTIQQYLKQDVTTALGLFACDARSLSTKFNQNTITQFR